MKKSKHFRKDVIIARVIAGILVIALIALIVFAVALLKKPSGDNKDTQNTQSTQSTQNLEPDVNIGTEPESESESEPELEPELEPESEGQTDDKVYVTTISQVRLRKEPNTECVTIELIDSATKLEVIETVEGWYKVIHNGHEGYVSADYVEIVEE